MGSRDNNSHALGVRSASSLPLSVASAAARVPIVSASVTCRAPKFPSAICRTSASAISLTLLILLLGWTQASAAITPVLQTTTANHILATSFGATRFAQAVTPATLSALGGLAFDAGDVLTIVETRSLADSAFRAPGCIMRMVTG